MEDIIITIDTSDLNQVMEIFKDGKDQVHFNPLKSCKECKIEPVGQEFENIWKRISKGDVEILDSSALNTSSETTTSNSNDDDDENSEEFKSFKEKYQNSHKDWHKKPDDHYAIMGLSHLKWRSTDDDIKQAYKRMILIVHPDKNEGGSDEAFKLLQKSYLILSDLKKRRAYDSQESFDDTIPSASDADSGDFYELFEPVFEMNSRFSLTQPAPKLGDDNTPYAQVLKFYDFWWGFKSWRDFSFEDDFELDQAESRDEKRWMEKQNEKKRSKQRKEESARIMNLANLAYKKDPRVAKKLKEDEDKKQQAKQAKIDAKKKQQEELEAEERAEREKVEREKQLEKEAAEEKKKQKKEAASVVKKSKESFRSICYTKPSPFTSEPKIEDVELICSELSHLELLDVSNKLTAASTNAEKSAIYDSYLKQVKDSIAEREKKLQESKKTKEATETADKVWTEEEVHQLAKGIQKYPTGVQNRWELVAEMVPTRTLKEVIARAKLAQPTKAYSKPTIQTTSHYDKLKSKVGDKQINSELSQRYESGSPTPTTTTTTTATTTTTTTPTTPKKEEAVWSEKEQKLLEEALQSVDKSLEDRWDRIAKSVGTKNKKECVARYKYLVTLYKNQAAAKK